MVSRMAAPLSPSLLLCVAFSVFCVFGPKASETCRQYHCHQLDDDSGIVCMYADLSERRQVCIQEVDRYSQEHLKLSLLKTVEMAVHFRRDTDSLTAAT